MTAETTDLDRLLRGVTRDLVAAGARAVVLVGSHARGDAGDLSDVDVTAIGEGEPYALERREGRLLSLAWRTEAQVREAFADPRQAGAAVPGWRGAVMLHDPDGVAAALQTEARAWRWDAIAEATDRWVASHLTGYVEEVHKLVAALERDAAFDVAVQRSVLALGLAQIVIAQRRLLYDTENGLWDLAAAEMGERWRRQQAAALGAGGEPLEASARAALALFVLAANEVRDLLDARQADVVASALALIGERLGDGDDDGAGDGER